MKIYYVSMWLGRGNEPPEDHARRVNAYISELGGELVSTYTVESQGGGSIYGMFKHKRKTSASTRSNIKE